jgi:hypothetical protein
MSVPDDVRAALQQRLWKEADALDWSNLTASRKSSQYESWTVSPSVGGILQQYMDRGQIRVYIKDTLLKKYTQHKIADPAVVLRILKLSEADIVKKYEKPHGFMTLDKQLVAWGDSSDWKLILMGIFERSHRSFGSRMRAVLLKRAHAHFHDDESTGMVKDACQKLGIEEVYFLD